LIHLTVMFSTITPDGKKNSFC